MDNNNTSGQGAASVVPPEIAGLNWGAFLLNWIWGLGNKTYIALLALIPFINIIMIFVLLFKGNEWAWRNKQWDSVEQFKSVQKKWAKWGVIILIVAIVIAIIAVVILMIAMKSSMNDISY